jgi:glycosyltransferase involved in cell wall biosynthesis
MMPRKPQVLLVFHTAYTFQIIRDLGLEIFVTARNSAGVFDQTVTINPLADLQTLEGSGNPRSKPRLYILDDKNIIIEGYSGRYSQLNNFPRINFVIAQSSLILYLLRNGFLNNVKLVRGEDPRFNGLFAFVVSNIIRVPLVIGVWGNPDRLRKLNNKPVMPRLFKSMRREASLEKFVLNHADLVLAQNNENLSYVLEANVPISKTAITPLGIGIDACHFIPPNHRPDFSKELEKLNLNGQLLFVCISRLESIKMVDHAIRACAIVAKSNIDFKLVIVGEGRDKLYLQNLAIELGLEENVIFAGNRSQNWISQLLPNVYLNIAPLCGRSLLEASLAGCPAVAYDVDWHADIVINEKTGFLVENLNFNELAKSIEKSLALTKESKSRMNSAMLQMALSQASPEILVQAQKTIYESLL